MKEYIISIYQKWTRRDYLLHLIVGSYIYMFTYILTQSDIISFVITAVFGIGKELIWDKYLKRGTPEVEDMVMTILGGLIILIYNNFII